VKRTNRKNTTKPVPTEVLVFSHEKTKFPGYAGRSIKFAPGKGFWFSEFFPGNLLSESCFSLFISGAWTGFINPLLQSVVNKYFSQTFERLLPKKKYERKSPRGWGVIKCQEFERKNPLKWVVSISRDYWIYFDITWKSSKNSEFWEKVPRIETFSSSKFDPATGIKDFRRPLWVAGGCFFQLPNRSKKKSERKKEREVHGSWCNWRASCVAAKQQQQKKVTPSPFLSPWHPWVLVLKARDRLEC